MDQQPWIFHLSDFETVRERIIKAVFSNIHRFFVFNEQRLDSLVFQAGVDVITDTVCSRSI